MQVVVPRWCSHCHTGARLPHGDYTLLVYVLVTSQAARQPLRPHRASHTPARHRCACSGPRWLTSAACWPARQACFGAVRLSSVRLSSAWPWSGAADSAACMHACTQCNTCNMPHAATCGVLLYGEFSKLHCSSDTRSPPPQLASKSRRLTSALALGLSHAALIMTHHCVGVGCRWLLPQAAISMAVHAGPSLTQPAAGGQACLHGHSTRFSCEPVRSGA